MVGGGVGGECLEREKICVRFGVGCRRGVGEGIGGCGFCW